MYLLILRNWMTEVKKGGNRQMCDSFFIAGDKVADWRVISYTASFGNMFHILHRYMKVWCEGSWSNCLKADINETSLRWYSNWILVFGFASVVLGGDLWRTKIMESLPQSLEFPNAIPRSISVSSFPNSSYCQNHKKFSF